jgi:hypothetical protein
MGGMIEKSWNDILTSFRANLAKWDESRRGDFGVVLARRRLKKFQGARIEPAIEPAPLRWHLRKSKEVWGRVYFIQRSDGLIKIGFTQNLFKRFRELQLTEGQGVILLGSIVASLRYEKRLHRMFGFCRSHREWFNPSPLLLLYLRVFVL